MTVNLTHPNRKTPHTPVLNGEDIRDLSFMLSVRIAAMTRDMEADALNGHDESSYWKDELKRATRLRAKLDALYSEDGLYAPPF